MKYLHPCVTYSSINHEEYSSNDLAIYYHNTYVLVDEGSSWTIGRVVQIDSSKAIVEIVGEEVEVEIQDVYKFVAEIGFYTAKGKMYHFSYICSKSYKKGLNPDFLSITTVPLNVYSTINHCKVLNEMFCVENVLPDSAIMVSRRIAGIKGKLYQSPTLLTLGDYKNGTIKTPLSQVKDRLAEGNLPCY